MVPTQVSVFSPGPDEQFLVLELYCRKAGGKRETDHGQEKRRGTRKREKELESKKGEGLKRES